MIWGGEDSPSLYGKMSFRVLTVLSLLEYAIILLLCISDLDYEVRLDTS